MISIALTHSPADMYISAAALGSLMLRAQSACFDIRFFFSTPSPDPMNSYITKYKRTDLNHFVPACRLKHCHYHEEKLQGQGSVWDLFPKQ